jgi:hypothetical protein
MSTWRRQILIVSTLTLLGIATAHAFWSKTFEIFRIHQAITSTALGTPLYTFDTATPMYNFSANSIHVINDSLPRARMRSMPPSRAAPPFSVTVNPRCRNPSATRLSNSCHVSDATAGPLAVRVSSNNRIDCDLLKYDTVAPMRNAGGTTNWKKKAPM